MWNITYDDVQRAKEQARLRRAEIEERYAEELKAAEAECAQIEALERVAAEFALKHKPQDSDAAATAQPAGEAGPNGSEGKRGSRWRFQFADRAGDGEDGPDPAA